MSEPLLDAYDEVAALVADLWAHPELGYQETYTSARVGGFLSRHVPDLEVTRFARTGLRLRLGPGHSRAVALVAELDALIVPAHPDADPVTGAVHACGHHTQVGIACAVVADLVHRPWDLPFDVVVVFVPAEEYVDLDTRRALREVGEIAWFGGKPEAMRLGVFDDVDAAILTHTMGGGYAVPTVELDCDLAGFAYKHVTFRGKAAHAGFMPHAGVNAASMAVLYQTAIGLGRQQLRDDVLARLNPVVSSAPMTTNVIPDTARVSTDVRTVDFSYLSELSATLDAMAQGAALALGGVAEVETEVGYLPFRQHRPLSEPFRDAFVAGVPGVDALLDDRGGSAAAGDVGDLSVMLPCIQIGYSGLEGTVHGADLRLVDAVTVLDAVPRFVLEGLRRLGPVWDTVVTYRGSYEEYVTHLSGLASSQG